MAIEIFNRQELKFVITTEQYAHVLNGLQPYMQRDKHNKAGRLYRLYNLYVDTSDNALIRHSMAKPVVYKEKIRIRSYTGFEKDPLVFLEIKKRYKRITNKRRTQILYRDALAFIKTGRLPRLHACMNMQVMREFETVFMRQQYYPKTFITYDRLAFSNRDATSDLRITFDTSIVARGYADTDMVSLLDADHIVMELKSTRNIPLWLSLLLSEHGINKHSFSKYGNAYLRQLAMQGAVYA